jgi:hypothetical protein
VKLKAWLDDFLRDRNLPRSVSLLRRRARRRAAGDHSLPALQSPILQFIGPAGGAAAHEQLSTGAGAAD